MVVNAAVCGASNRASRRQIVGVPRGTAPGSEGAHNIRIEACGRLWKILWKTLLTAR